MTTTHARSAEPEAPQGLRAGQVAEAAGVNRETLRYYERRGLLAEPSRSPGGHRLYPAEARAAAEAADALDRLGRVGHPLAGLRPELVARRRQTGPRAVHDVHRTGLDLRADGLARVAAAHAEGALPAAEVTPGMRIGAPVVDPQALLCIGLN